MHHKEVAIGRNTIQTCDEQWLVLASRRRAVRIKVAMVRVKKFEMDVGEIATANM
jgi:hypothetical protein